MAFLACMWVLSCTQVGGIEISRDMEPFWGCRYNENNSTIEEGYYNLRGAGHPEAAAQFDPERCACDVDLQWVCAQQGGVCVTRAKQRGRQRVCGT